MIDRTQESLGRVLLTVVVALVLSVLPLPSWLAVVRPAFLVITVLYWSITAPRVGGIGLGFFCGVALDVFRGALLGQQALALTAITYVVVREHQKIRLKPAFQQALIMLGALVAYEFILFAIDGWTGHPMTSPLRWIHAFTGALIWPLATALLDRVRGTR
ncbi:MAG: rod shape-determining protein MreD [Steroidobacteraceae bacterium]